MKEVEVIRPQEGKQELALNLEADVIFCGGSAGSAKTFTLLMRALAYIDDPFFRGIYFRRTTKQIEGQGGLWDEAQDLYGKFGAKFDNQKLIATFPSGAKIEFSHLQHEKHKKDHQGLQYSAIFFDELTHFSGTQFSYLLSRLRSKAEGNSFVMCSMNPDPDTWVLDWVIPYLDEQGYFNNEMAGKIKYFYTIEDKPIFDDDPEVLKRNFPEQHKIYNATDDTYEYVEPKSFTFLGSTIFDNPILIKSNPNYLAELSSLPEVEKARLLYGNWFARAQGSNYFNRNDLVRVAKVPKGVMARGWDKASTEPSDKERHPDFTASVGMIKTQDGRFCIVGNYCPTNQEDDGIYKGRFRKPPSQRDQIIIEQALYDGKDCKVILPIDVGQAGKSEYQNHARRIIAKGITVRPDPMPTNKSKITKYSPFSSAVGAGLVDIVESTFPDRATLEMFYKEHEAFDGERSSATRKDDWVDSTATVFNYLNEQETIPDIVLPNMSQANPFKV